MDFTISRDSLTHGLSRVQSIIDKKSTMAILSNVLVEAEEDGIKLTATDLEIGIVGKYQADVRKQGSLAVAARSFYEIVRQLPAEELSVTLLPNHRIEIVSGKAKYRLLGVSAEEFPSLPTFDDAKLVSLEASSLSNMIGRTIYAVSQDETRYNLSGVFFEPAGGDKLKLVATDGHRLSLAEGAVEKSMGFGLKEGVIIPRKGLGELKKLLEESKGESRLGFTSSHAVYKNENLSLVMRLVDGRFPDYMQVIPRDNDKIIKLNRQSFLDSLRRVSIMSPDRSQSVRFEFSAGKLTITSQHPDLGDAQEEIDIEYDGSELGAGFNAGYMKEALQTFVSEEVKLELADELSPVNLKADDDPHYLCVIMPMRI
jgi:DNA polymerase-3 subunit beta